MALPSNPKITGNFVVTLYPEKAIRSTTNYEIYAFYQISLLHDLHREYAILEDVMRPLNERSWFDPAANRCYNAADAQAFQGVQHVSLFWVLRMETELRQTCQVGSKQRGPTFDSYNE